MVDQTSVANYTEYPLADFFNQIASEKQAIELVWAYKSENGGHKCERCGLKKYYQHHLRPEIRECRHCGHQSRLRVNTIFQNSKVPMLTWVRAIYLMMMGKRGVSALELQRQLKIGSYKTALYMLHKIRGALLNRDEQYKLRGVIEMDGASFGKSATENQEKVLIAIESKEFFNEKGEVVPKAGFAKVYFGNETTENAQEFVNKDIRVASEIHTDGAKAYLQGLDNVDVESVATYGDDNILNEWLPWVHKFISNAKAWIVGTHHGVNSKYFRLYLAEYTYRFNRRHDVKKYFSRALFSCLLLKPPLIQTLKAA